MDENFPHRPAGRSRIVFPDQIPEQYGRGVSERLIHEALYPYPDDLVIATKADFTRPSPDRSERNGKPEHLRAQAEKRTCPR